MKSKLTVNVVYMVITALLLSLLTPVLPVSAENEKVLHTSNNSLDSILEKDEFVVVDGEKVFFEREIKDGVSNTIVKNEKDEVLSEFSLNMKTNEAILDGVRLSREEYEEIVALGKSELNSSLNNNDNLSESQSTNPGMYATKASCTYKKIGKTKKRSTWIPRTGVAAVAAVILTTSPGIGVSIAWAIAGAVSGTSNTLYYTVAEYSCKSGGYYHLKTTRKFYKKSNYTGHIKTVNVYGKRR